MGQTAGSYGKSASEVGKNASDVGTNAGDYSQTASSLPSNVSSQTAGSYGQTAGSFGMSSSDFHGPPPARAANATEGTASRDSKAGQWVEFQRRLHEAFPELQVKFVEVLGVELRQRLAAAASAGVYPDVLLSDRMPDWWAGAAHGNVLLALGAGRTSFPGERGGGHARQSVYHDAYGLAGAPHPVAAREFLEWWNGQESGPGQHEAVAGGKPSPAAAVAIMAVAQVLSGGAPDGLADKDMALFSGAATRSELLGAEDSLPGDLRFHTDVVREQHNQHLAVVLLRTACLSRTAYCELHPLVMLRANERGMWKILHISLGMDAGEAAGGFELTATSAQPDAKPKEALAEVAMPKLAAPVDGDQRAVRSGLSLWFDNGGGGSSLVVEWQQAGGRSAPASHLLVVSDTGGKLRNEVPAPFAGIAGAVRWRVWAVGEGGVVRLSEWRAVTMVQ